MRLVVSRHHHVRMVSVDGGLRLRPYGRNTDRRSSLIGYPPFCADTAVKTCKKILSYRESLTFPDGFDRSRPDVDLIRRLLCRADKRLDFTGIKRHRFFEG